MLRRENAIIELKNDITLIKNYLQEIKKNIVSKKEIESLKEHIHKQNEVLKIFIKNGWNEKDGIFDSLNFHKVGKRKKYYQI